MIHLIALKDRKHDRSVAFLNAHLYFHRLAERIRALQVASSIRELNSFVDSIETSDVISKIVLGDLNSTPETMAIELLLTNKVSWKHFAWTDWIRRVSLEDDDDEKKDPEYSVHDRKRHGNLPVQFNRFSRHDAEKETDDDDDDDDGDDAFLKLYNVHFSSCFDRFYRNDEEEDDEFPLTNCDENFDGTLDWILLESSKLKFLQVSPSSSSSNTRLRSDMRTIPCPGYPSDHIPVVADVMYLPS